MSENEHQEIIRDQRLIVNRSLIGFEAIDYCFWREKKVNELRPKRNIQHMMCTSFIFFYIHVQGNILKLSK
jgi:hypothetical protein